VNKISKANTFLALFLAQLLLQAAVVPLAQAKKYYIYGEPKNGSKFKQQLYVSNIPLNKPYGKLSSKQKKLIRSLYPDLEAEQTPPYPKKGLRKLVKPFVEQFQWRGSNGGKFSALISSDGKVKELRAVEDVDQRELNFMWKIFQKTEFEAAICDGSPCEMTFYLQLGEIKQPVLQAGDSFSS